MGGLFHVLVCFVGFCFSFFCPRLLSSLLALFRSKFPQVVCLRLCELLVSGPVNLLSSFLAQVSETCIIHKAKFLIIWRLQNGDNHVGLALGLESDRLLEHFGSTLFKNFLHIGIGTRDGQPAEGISSVDCSYLVEI